MSTLATDPARRFLEALDGHPGIAAGSGPVALARRHARERFAESGFPTRRHENWRYSELRPLIDARFASAGTADAGALDRLLGQVPAVADLLVFVDGTLDPVRSRVGDLPDGASVGGFAEWSMRHPEAAAGVLAAPGGQDRAFASLNAAFFSDGAAIMLPDDAVLDRPIHVVHSNRGTASHLRGFVRLGDRARATVIETYIGSGSGWTNAVSTIELGEGARLGRYVLQDEAPSAFHTTRLDVRIGKAARLEGFLLSLGGRLAREDGDLVLAGSHGYCGYSGAYLLSGSQESTVASVIRHEAPNCACREVFKGCVDDRAHRVFQGKIHVAQAAQKTDGYQLNKTILLSDRAIMDAKPELEIYADDVKCSHGATVGDLDDTALFYLRSRGIEPEIARRMLIEAFVMDAVDQIEDASARSWLAAAVAQRLGGSRP